VRGPRIDDQYARPTLTGLHAEQPEPARRWLRAPTAIRVIDTRYDPDDDTAHRMAGGSLADWFDVVAFVRRITPVHYLVLGSTAWARRGQRRSRRS
jgi:erythromycin esterase